MLSSTIQSNRQLLAARIILAVLVGALVSIMAAAGPGGLALAQTSPATPPPAGQTIEFINPSKTSSLEVSDKFDGTDERYHIVAAVGTVPQNPIVEFELVKGNNVLATYPAFRVGVDTWEHFWDIPDVADGEYTLRAILYSGPTTEVDRDEEVIQINNKVMALPTDVEDQAETVEITYPTNAGPLGVYIAPDGTANFVMDYTASAGTRFVAGFYSQQPPGSEPQFKSCVPASRTTPPATGTPPARSSGRYRCQLATNDFGNAVTMVALVANDTPSPSSFNATFNDSSDGHRVFAYVQVPGSLSVEPPTTTAFINTCSEMFIATVLDQRSRPIAGHNVDVHATGPTDNLRFDTDVDPADANKAPDKGGHTTESAYNCETKAPGGTQGEHNAAGAPDRKHIESTTGTDEKGQFEFRLFSPETGPTQITAWADSDDDDLQCTSEPADAASIGWGTTEAPGSAPPPTLDPSDTSNCSIPSPTPSPTPTTSPTTSSSASPSVSPSKSPSASPSVSPSKSPSASPSASPSQSPSASPSQSPSASPSASPSTSPSPKPECSDGVDNDGDGFTDMNDPSCDSPSDDNESPEDQVVTRRPRTLEITKMKHVTVGGKNKPALLIKGIVNAPSGITRCEKQVPVKVQIRAGGEWITRKSDTTNNNAVFKVLIRDVQAKYRAVATKFQSVNPNRSNEIDECLKAADKRRHNH